MTMALQHALRFSMKRTLRSSPQVQRLGQSAQRRLAASSNSPPPQPPNLAKQRLNRPVSPHLSIYRPNMALYGSGFNRITAVTLAGSLYLAGLAYLAAPVFGYHVDTQSMVAVVAGWPAGVKYGIKGFFAFPFFYHGLNGLRHLAWDVGVGFQNKTVVRTGWGVVGASVVGTVYFVLWG